MMIYKALSQQLYDTCLRAHISEGQVVMEVLVTAKQDST